MDHTIRSGGLRLAAHLAEPEVTGTEEPPGVVLCHGFPPRGAGAAGAPVSFPELADRIATEMGWVALAPAFRGCGGSEGDFSLGGWLDDVTAAADDLRQLGVASVWLTGFGTGGALCICAAARDPEVRGVAVCGSPADFDDWARSPRRLLLHAQEIGVIRSEGFPRSFDAWAKDLRRIRAVECVGEVADRPLLVMHGSDDDLVPTFDARVVADEHGSAELRIIEGAGHELRHDPRAVAVLLGWLDRQWHGRERVPA